MTSKSKKPIRILHVLGGMNRGGVETWLMHILRHIDRERFYFDFLVHTTEPCAYDEEIRELGSQIIPCLKPSRPWCYAMNFARILKEHGPYDVVHSHVHHYSGFVLWLAHKAGVHIRISHSHSDTSQSDSNARIIRRVYLRIMEHLLKQYATTGVACSDKAASALFSAEWKKNARRRILYCGVDIFPFSETVFPAEVRRELGIPTDAYVVGHVGRFSDQKNHAFLVDIVKCMVQHNSKVLCLLVGDGPLRSSIESKIRQLGLSDHVIFAGLRSDVPRLMVGAMDVFLLPSLNEGLPLVLIEAQAAGIPIIVSDNVTREIDVVPGLLTWLSLSESASVWANAATATWAKKLPVTQHAAYGIMKQSPFEIQASIQNLLQMYKGEASL